MALRIVAAGLLFASALGLSGCCHTRSNSNRPACPPAVCPPPAAPCCPPGGVLPPPPPPPFR